MMTTRDQVYAGGDAVTGAATVILAMGAGRRLPRPSTLPCPSKDSIERRTATGFAVRPVSQFGGNGKKDKSFYSIFCPNRGFQRQSLWSSAAADEIPAPRAARNARPPQRAKPPSVPKRHPQMAQPTANGHGSRRRPLWGWTAGTICQPMSTNAPPTMDVGRDLCVPPLVCTIDQQQRRGRHP